jgi:uncharacterized coiled-coil protein SlyX
MSYEKTDLTCFDSQLVRLRTTLENRMESLEATNRFRGDVLSEHSRKLAQKDQQIIDLNVIILTHEKELRALRDCLAIRESGVTEDALGPGGAP